MANPSASILADFARLGIGIFSPNLYLLFHRFSVFGFQHADSYITTAIRWTNLGGTGSGDGACSSLTRRVSELAYAAYGVVSVGVANVLGFRISLKVLNLGGKLRSFERFRCEPTFRQSV